MKTTYKDARIQVNCDFCRAKNFKSNRYNCTQYEDYDLCESCFKNGAFNLKHKLDHPIRRAI